MEVTTFRTVARRKECLAVIGQARNFKVDIDEPISSGGTDIGMNPVEMFLCALGGCQTIVASSFAKKFHIDFQDFLVELEGDIDLDGFMGLLDVRPGYQTIRYNMHIKCDASEEKIKRFVGFIEKTCPVGDTLGNEVKLERTKITIEK